MLDEYLQLFQYYTVITILYVHIFHYINKEIDKCCSPSKLRIFAKYQYVYVGKFTQKFRSRATYAHWGNSRLLLKMAGNQIAIWLSALGLISVDSSLRVWVCVWVCCDVTYKKGQLCDFLMGHCKQEDQLSKNLVISPVCDTKYNTNTKELYNLLLSIIIQKNSLMQN